MSTSAWTPENIAALITGATALVGALGVFFHSVGTRKIATTAAATANQSLGHSKAVASAVLSTPAAPSNTVTEKLVDQAPSEQAPPL